MPKDYAETGMERLKSALRGFTPGSREWYADQIYGTGVPADIEQKRAESADFIASMTPVIGEGMALRDAWDASGRGGQALMQGDVGDAAGEYMDMLSALGGGLLPFSVQKLTSSAMPSDPQNTTMIFAGPTAKTADHAALAQAQEMKAQGASRADIWRETGWDLEKADKIPRFEIDDSGARFPQPASHQLLESERPIQESFEHPELFAAYSDMNPSLTESIVSQGWYDPDVDRIGIRGVLPERKYGSGSAASAKREYNAAAEAQRGTTLHELQHAVQGREGLAQGGNVGFDARMRGYDTRFPEIKSLQNELNEARELRAYAESKGATPEKLASLDRAIQDRMNRLDKAAERIGYQNLAGEVEARNVQSRMNMTAPERRATPPWETQDVPDDQQIVRFR